MVSMMEIEPKSPPPGDHRPTLTQSAISQRSIELHIQTKPIDSCTSTTDITKRTLTLDLKRSDENKRNIDDDESKPKIGIISPKSPLSITGKSKF